LKGGKKRKGRGTQKGVALHRTHRSNNVGELEEGKK